MHTLFLGYIAISIFYNHQYKLFFYCVTFFKKSENESLSDKTFESKTVTKNISFTIKIHSCCTLPSE